MQNIATMNYALSGQGNSNNQIQVLVKQWGDGERALLKTRVTMRDVHLHYS